MTAQLAAEGTEARFTPIGHVELKGVSGTLQLHSAHRTAADRVATDS